VAEEAKFPYDSEDEESESTAQFLKRMLHVSSQPSANLFKLLCHEGWDASEQQQQQRAKRARSFIRALCYELDGEVAGFPFKAYWTTEDNEIHYHKFREFKSAFMRNFAKKCMRCPGVVMQVEGARQSKKQRVAQYDEGIRWPREIHQNKDAHCVRNALLNLGVPRRFLDGCDGIDTLRQCVDMLAKQRRFPFYVRRIRRFSVPDCFLRGRFVFAADTHCYTAINGVYLDTDPRWPFPTRDLGALGVGNIITVYQFTRRRFRK